MNQRIVIADDDEAITEAVKIMLEDEGYSVDVVYSGAEVKHLEQNLPAVLILDIWMAGENGRSICIYLKNREATRKLPIILCSANKDVKSIAQEIGADDFLLKPFDIDELLDKVRHFI